MSHSKKYMLSFFLTTKCNLKCIYCYSDKSHHANQTLDLDFAKYAIDLYIAEDNFKHIRFFGAGEPTVEFELMKEITDYAQTKINHGLKVELQTNGVFDTTVRDWLKENLDIIWISVDGTPDLQDTCRPLKNGKGSSKLIEENIKYLTNYGKGMTGIRSTITNQNITRQMENIDYFSELGVKYIWSDPIFPAVGDEIVFFENIDMMQYAEEFVKAKEYANTNGIFYESFLTCNFDENTHINCRACIPTPHLTTDGYISACDMALFGENKNHMDVFIYGRWDKDRREIIYNEDKIKILQSRTVENLSECSNCEAKYHCAGYCLGEVQNEVKDLFRRKKQICKPVRFLFHELPVNFGTYKYLHP